MVASVNTNFIVQNGLTAGPATIFAGNGDVITSGNITVTGGGSFGGLSSNQIYQSTSNVNVNSASVTVGVGGANVGLTIPGNFTVNGTTTTINTETATFITATTVNAATIGNAGASGQFGTVTATNVYGATIGNASAVLYGTLNSSSASQPNITTLAGVTSIGASSATTLTGTLQTASQTNITAVGTLSGLTVSAAVVPNANASVNLGSTSAYWNNAYVNALTATGITVNSGKVLPGANAAIDIGSTAAYFNNIYGINFYGTSTTAKYADLAENYQADKYYNPGTVLQFGGTAEVTLADADTTRVAGVVSTNPAHLMNGALSGPNVTALALTGRVPCMVVGPVAKGDLMVSAGWGYAKSNNGAGVGQVIGKALQDFPMNSKGVIEVVVGRF